jgi:DNA modification methylase
MYEDRFQERITKIERRRVGEVLKNSRNPRAHGEIQNKRLTAVLEEFGKVGVLVTYRGADGRERLFDGHARQGLNPDEMWFIAETDLKEQEVRELVLLYDPLAGLADWREEIVIETVQDLNIVADDGVLEEMVREIGQEAGLEIEGDGGRDTEPQIDKAAELQKKWGVERGDLWQIGEHRLVCGDCTDAAVVERVMGGDIAVLLMGDPPYGMGKEKDGIANDNLYREKLDAFQMKWWQAARPFIADNGSVYIWGNAEDLWRLWYRGGLRDSERLTFRNEIVWNKGDIGAGAVSLQNNAGMRKYPPAGGERCLFFVLGEQSHSENADNYWDGWENIRLYLKGERDKLGWDNAKCKTLAGHSPTSGCHWFDKSQWTMPTREVYESWQQAARSHDAFKREYDAFKREYDDLKREFYATRAYFDNTHDNMTDVWKFNRVQGEDRHEHATPKPVEMIARIVKSSSPPDSIILDPFGGSGTTMIACHNLNRQCRMIEIDPGYCAVILERMAEHTGIVPERISE